MKPRLLFRYLIIVLVAFFCRVEITGQSLFQKTGNYRIYPSQVLQSEVFITNSPLDDEVLFASCNTLIFSPFFVSEGIYVTENGGLSWQGNDTCTGAPITYHGGDPGIAIDKEGTFILTRLGRAPLTGLYAHFSNDRGKTWSAAQVISTDDLERASVTSDLLPNSSYFGRTYAAWVKFAQPFPVVFSYTDDGGQSWSSPVSINSPANRSAGGDVAIGAGGEVYVCWAGVTETSPFKEIQVGFAKSADGGGQWSVYENAFAVNGITGVLPEKGNIRVNGLPAIDTDTTSGPYHGNIYIVTGQKNLAPSGNDPDIVLYRSTDDGNNWSQGIRVNQDAINNGKIQYFPSIHVDRYGAINILFYDDRNTTSDSTGVYLARSTDAGESWTEFEISDHHFKPEPIGGLGQGYQGDNIDLTSTPSTLWPVWMDNSSGLYQIWTAPVDFSAIGQIEEQNNDLGNRISIAPNPVVNSLRIRLKYIQNETVSVNFYNLNGKRLYSGEFIASSEIHQTHQMDLPDLMPFKSVFLVEIKSEKVKKVQRVIRAR